VFLHLNVFQLSVPVVRAVRVMVVTRNTTACSMISNTACRILSKNNHTMRFQVLTATRIKTTVFWDVAPCSLVETDRRFRGAFCLHHQGRRPDYGGSKHLLKRRSISTRLHGATSQKTSSTRTVIPEVCINVDADSLSVVMNLKNSFKNLTTQFH
jgi:hypothetical protein